MNARLLALATLAIGLVFSASDLLAGDSPVRPPVRPAHDANCATCPNTSPYYRDCPFVPRPYNLCRPTPITVYRYGSPKGVKSACAYGYPSDRDDIFYRNYPVSRGR